MSKPISTVDVDQLQPWKGASLVISLGQQQHKETTWRNKTNKNQQHVS